MLSLSACFAGINSFISHGGYRFCPIAVEYPDRIVSGRPITLQHTWRNLGFGLFPNDNSRWHQKYRVAFALLDANSHPLAIAIDRKTDPAQWIAGGNFAQAFEAAFSAVPGAYRLAVGIIDTSNHDQPGIQLAVANLPQAGGWYVLGPVSIVPSLPN